MHDLILAGVGAELIAIEPAVTAFPLHSWSQRIFAKRTIAHGLGLLCRNKRRWSHEVPYLDPAAVGFRFRGTCPVPARCTQRWQPASSPSTRPSATSRK